MSNRTGLISIPDPQIYQPIPDKKPKNIDPENNPSQHPVTKILSQGETHDMEIQGEKKRRREEDNNTVNSEVTEHFLTAGPGSQDCRDQ
jgi:hypothetical protein